MGGKAMDCLLQGTEVSPSCRNTTLVQPGK